MRFFVRHQGIWKKVAPKSPDKNIMDFIKSSGTEIQKGFIGSDDEQFAKIRAGDTKDRDRITPTCAIPAGAFISFVLSNAEYTVSFFTSGRAQPLSILVASDFRFHLSPSLNALAMLIVFFNILIIAMSEWFRYRSTTFRVNLTR